MDRRADLTQISLLAGLSLCNITDPESSVYNFSSSEAMDLLMDFRNNMLTIQAPTTIALLCLYIPTFVISLGGNLLVIYVTLKHAHMRRVKNLFLMNLSVADLFVTLVCIPVVSGQTIYRLWLYGGFMCKLSGYMQGWAVTCSIFTLSAMSIDRYMAIKCPTSSRRLTGKCQVLTVLTFVWIFAGAFAGPLLYTRTIQTIQFKCLDIEFSYCIEEWPDDIGRQIYGVITMVITYVIPITIAIVCYGLIGKTLCSDEFPRDVSHENATIVQGRKRVARMLIVLIVAFVVCWLPYNASSLRMDLSPEYRESQILPFTLWLGHAHSALNPVLYWLLNRSFRHHMREVLQCHKDKKSGRGFSPSPQSLAPQSALKQTGYDPQPFINLRDRLRLRNEYHFWMPANHSDHKDVPRIIVYKPEDNKQIPVSNASNKTGLKSILKGRRRKNHQPKSNKNPFRAETFSKQKVKLNDVPKKDRDSAHGRHDARNVEVGPGKSSSSVSNDSTTQPTSPSSGMLGFDFRTTNSISV